MREFRVTIRLTKDELTALKHLSQGKLSKYIRKILFNYGDKDSK